MHMKNHVDAFPFMTNDSIISVSERKAEKENMVTQNISFPELSKYIYFHLNIFSLLISITWKLHGVSKTSSLHLNENHLI